MKIEIKNRLSAEIMFSVEAETKKYAVEKLVSEKADLRGADLRKADLSWADLSGADLSWADLSGAYLSGAYLRKADLSGADLRKADLSGADLRKADLSGADLSGADLFFANPTNATQNYMILMTQTHIKIGCKFFRIAEWFKFDDYEIKKMDGERATKFWTQWKPILMQIAKNNGWYQD